GHLFTDDDGSFRFWCLTPTPYPIPHDGPVGRLLDAVGRSPMRAAHLHFMVTAENLRTLVTHIFVEGDPQLDIGDAVFSVKKSLSNGSTSSHRARRRRTVETWGTHRGPGRVSTSCWRPPTPGETSLPAFVDGHARDDEGGDRGGPPARRVPRLQRHIRSGALMPSKLSPCRRVWAVSRHSAS